MSNDTPRTDDHTYGGNGIIGAGYVSADFARQLERELNEAKDAIEHHKKWLSDSSLESWFPITAEELTQLRAELEKAGESLHYSNGVADLAMKHRDAAEQELEKWHAMAKELATELEYGPVAGCKGTALARFNELEKSI